MKRALVLSFFCLLLLFVLTACPSGDHCVLVFHSDVSMPLTQVISAGDTDGYEPPEAPDRQGYTFLGWYMDPEYTTPFDASYITGNTTLNVYASYEKNSYTLILMSGTEVQLYTYAFGDEILPPEPTSPQLIFDGFYADAAYTERLTAPAMPDSDTTLYVRWRVKPTFTFTAVFHDGSDTVATESIDSSLLDEYVWPSPEKVGHLFRGWYWDEECTAPFSASDIEDGEDTVHLYAYYEKRTYTITVFTGTGSESYSCIFGDPITIPEPDGEQLVFDGFYLDGAFTEPLSDMTMPATDLSLYVKWKNAPDTVITVLLHTGGDSPSMLMLEMRELSGYSWPNPDKEGHTFLGWYLDEDCRTPFDPSAVEDETTLHLYADYLVNTYTLTVYDGGKTTAYYFRYGEKILLETPPSDYFAFVGFYLDRGSQVPFSYTTMPATDLNVYIKWGMGSTVTVKSSISGALSFRTGSDSYVKNELSQMIVRADQFLPVTPKAELGYVYTGYIVNGVFYEGSTITLSKLTGDTEIIAVADYATYELPIINITTKNGAGIHSKVQYTEMVFELLNADEELSGITGGIRLRGNTTMTYAKKPYRIKFDKKQSLFGHAKAKSWVLLAEYLDPSALHNYTALSLGQIADGMKFNATPHKVNVYINGRYDGLYTLCEQIQENEGRIDIEQTITPDMTDIRDYNFFFTLDESVTGDIDAIEGETYFVTTKYGGNGGRLCFELKYPEKSDFPSEAQFYSFFSQWTQYVEEMMDIAVSKDYARMQQEYNLDSLIDYFIIDQIMGEHDHAKKSFNMYHTVTSSDEREIGKLTFGPIWDYDWALHTPWTGSPNIYYEVEAVSNYSNAFFRAVRDIEPLYTRAKQRYQDHFYPEMAALLSELYQLQADMKTSYALNALCWYSGQTTITADNINFLNRYLEFTIEHYRTKWKLS